MATTATHTHKATDVLPSLCLIDSSVEVSLMDNDAIALLVAGTERMGVINHLSGYALSFGDEFGVYRKEEYTYEQRSEVAREVARWVHVMTH